MNRIIFLVLGFTILFAWGGRNEDDCDGGDDDECKKPACLPYCQHRCKHSSHVERNGAESDFEICVRNCVANCPVVSDCEKILESYFCTTDCQNCFPANAKGGSSTPLNVVVEVGSGVLRNTVTNCFCNQGISGCYETPLPDIPTPEPHGVCLLESIASNCGYLSFNPPTESAFIASICNYMVYPHIQLNLTNDYEIFFSSFGS